MYKHYNVQFVERESVKCIGQIETPTVIETSKGQVIGEDQGRTGPPRQMLKTGVERRKGAGAISYGGRALLG